MWQLYVPVYSCVVEGVRWFLDDEATISCMAMHHNGWWRNTVTVDRMGHQSANDGNLNCTCTHEWLSLTIATIIISNASPFHGTTACREIHTITDCQTLPHSFDFCGGASLTLLALLLLFFFYKSMEYALVKFCSTVDSPSASNFILSPLVSLYRSNDLVGELVSHGWFTNQCEICGSFSGAVLHIY
jgi:hypothetical protein